MSDESPAARAGRYAAHVLTFGRAKSSAELSERILAPTALDVRQALAACLAPDRVATAVLGPKAGLEAGALFERALHG